VIQVYLLWPLREEQAVTKLSAVWAQKLLYSWESTAGVTVKLPQPGERDDQYYAKFPPPSTCSEPTMCIAIHVYTLLYSLQACRAESA
jgi:hypothetical protein